MSFEKLLADLAKAESDQETLSKALPTADEGMDDDKVQDAAAEGAAKAAGDGDADDKGGKPDGDADDKKPMTKSFEVVLPDGTKVQAEDGTELVKSLTARLEKSEGTMVKAMECALGLIKSQGEMLKSLGDQVKKLSGEGRGRKAVVTMAEKKDQTTLAKSESQADGLTGEQFLVKALTAQKAGRITAADVAIAEGHLNRGIQPPAEIVQRVLQ